MPIVNIYFQPWVGVNYPTTTPKILVIGDSHYCGECEMCGVHGEVSLETMGDCKNFTIDRVKEYLRFRQGGEKIPWMTKTFLPFDKIYYHKQDVSGEESMTLWNRIAFYNFVQTAHSGETSNSSYSTEDYSKSSPIATKVFTSLQPDKMIVWGDKVYNSLTDEGWTQETDISGHYTLSNGHIIAVLRMPHPSRADQKIWGDKLKTFLIF